MPSKFTVNIDIRLYFSSNRSDRTKPFIANEPIPSQRDILPLRSNYSPHPTVIELQCIIVVGSGIEAFQMLLISDNVHRNLNKNRKQLVLYK